ncbi:MAG: serine hydrolase family protein [Nanoarchaeota archaeon]|nr:serine hydrolase family protein [Nanoarchaeota archaeon]
MKRVFLIHKWEGKPDSHWFPWLREKLEAEGFEVHVLEMPDTKNPKIEPWVGKLQEEVGEVDEETYFIGHSIGGQAILRYLERQDGKCGGVVLVAPWMHLDEQTIKEEGEEFAEIARPWIETPINFSKVKENSDRFVCLFSDNDPYVPLSDRDIFRELLGSRILTLHERAHFDEEKDFPELLEEFLKLARE